MPLAKAKCFVKKEHTFSSQTKHLSAARNMIADMALSCGFSDQQLFDIKLASGEAIANAIEHGSPQKEENDITVRCYCNGIDFMVEIADQGKFKNDLPIGTGDNINFRGRGILIMLALMDKVTIDESKEGTTVFLSKRFPTNEDIKISC